MSGVSVLRAVRVPLYLGGEEGKGLASLGPFLLLEGLRQAPSKDPEQTLGVVLERFTCSLCYPGSVQCHHLVADPDSSCPFALFSPWLTSWHT